MFQRIKKKHTIFSLFLIVSFFYIPCAAEGTALWLEDAPQTKNYINNAFDGYSYDNIVDDDPWYTDASPIKSDDKLDILLYDCKFFEGLAITSWDFGPIQALVILRRILKVGQWSFEDKEAALQTQRRASRLVKDGDYQTLKKVKEAVRQSCNKPYQIETLQLPIHLDAGAW